jgi:methyl-accepting chemotaxis protein
MLNNLKIGSRLGLAFGTTLLLTVALGTVAIVQMDRYQDAANTVSDNSLPSVRTLGEMDAALSAYRANEYRLVLASGPAEVNEVERQLGENISAYRKSAAEYEKLISSDEERRLFQDITSRLQAYQSGTGALKELVRAGRQKDAAALMAAEHGRRYDEMGAIVDKDVDLNNRSALALGEQADRIFEVAMFGTIAFGILAVVLGALAAWWISRSITRPLSGALSVADAIADGDLSRRIAATSRDEVGALLNAMSRMQEALARMVGELKDVVGAAARGDFSRRIDAAGMRGFQQEIASEVNTLASTSEAGINEVVRVLGALSRGDLTEKITNDYQGSFGQLKDDSNKTVEQLTLMVKGIKESVDTIEVASREIASGNADLSQRTEEQASSLEETASSMEELTSTVKQNADNAQQANQLAIGASEVATRGGRVVGEVVTTMQGITDASRKIADIISVIDGIAFQTNILALNAAVEAARAGEQGRGFAVVATEVRTLAQRSATAAKEIKALIEDSVGKVETGSRQVDEAGKTMDEIVKSVKRVTDIMGDITAASREQSAGIEQVSTAVSQMDEVTQQNAALVEQAAAAAESLEEQAQVLLRSVARFTLEPGQAASAAAPSPAETPKVARIKPRGPAPVPQKVAARKVAAGDSWDAF